MAPPTESSDIVVAEQMKEEEKNKKEAEEEAMKLRHAQLELANSLRSKGRPGNNNRQLVSKAKMLSSDSRPGSKSHHAQTSMSKPDLTSLLVMELPATRRIRMGVIEWMEPETKVDQPGGTAAAVASVSTSTTSEKIIFIGQIPVRIPSSLEETTTNDQEMNNNVELVLEKDSEGNSNAEEETVPGTITVTATVNAEEIDDLSAVSEATQVANAMDMEVIPLVSETNITTNHGKSDDDNNVEASEAIGEDEQNESNGKTFVLGTATTVTTCVPALEGNNVNDVLETDQYAGLLNMKESLVASEAKTNMDQANNGKDDGFEVVRRKKPRKEKPNASNEEATEKTENQTQIKKAEATKKRGCKEQDTEAAKGVEEAAIVEKKTHKKERETIATANRTEVEERVSAPATEDKNHDCVYEEERDQEAKRVKEAAAAKKKREKRERKKKRKAEKLGKSCVSVILLPCLALVGLLVYGYLQVS